MWLTESESRGSIVVVLVVLFGLAMLLAIQTAKIEALKAERDVKAVELEALKVAAANPKVTRITDTKIKVVERKVNLTADQKAAIAQQYEMQLADLQAIIDAVSERTTTLDTSGKSTTEMVLPAAKAKRWTLAAEVFNDYKTAGVAYEIIPAWGLSMGVGACDRGQIGGIILVKF